MPAPVPLTLHNAALQAEGRPILHPLTVPHIGTFAQRGEGKTSLLCHPTGPARAANAPCSSRHNRQNP